MAHVTPAHQRPLQDFGSRQSRYKHLKDLGGDISGFSPREVKEFGQFPTGSTFGQDFSQIGGNLQDSAAALMALFSGGPGRSFNGGDAQRAESGKTLNNRGFPPPELIHNLAGDLTSIGGTAANPLSERDLLGSGGEEPLEYANVMANQPSIRTQTPPGTTTDGASDRKELSVAELHKAFGPKPPPTAPEVTTDGRAATPDLTNRLERHKPTTPQSSAASQATGLESILNIVGGGLDTAGDWLLDVDESVVNAIDNFFSREGPERDARQAAFRRGIEGAQGAFSGDMGSALYNAIYGNDAEAPPESLRQQEAEPARRPRATSRIEPEPPPRAVGTVRPDDSARTIRPEPARQSPRVVAKPITPDPPSAVSGEPLGLTEDEILPFARENPTRAEEVLQGAANETLMEIIQVVERGRTAGDDLILDRATSILIQRIGAEPISQDEILTPSVMDVARESI